MKFTDLVEIAELQGLCESFTASSNTATAILDLEGNVLVATGWQDICTQFHRVNPETAARCLESDTVLAGRLAKRQEHNIYRCRNGLLDAAMPITVGGEHVANFFAGQFFIEPPDRKFFEKQAEQFGFDKKAYLEALSRVPIYTETQVRATLDFFQRLASLMGENGLARKRVEESNAQLRLHQEHLEDLVKERTAELELARDRAEIANRAKSTFLAKMSHELRTPLNAVLGFSRLLRNSPEASPAQIESLNIILRSGEHLLNLINNVLDIAKIEAGRVVREEGVLDLHQTLQEIKSMMTVQAVDKGLAFAMSLARDVPQFVLVDSGKLRQVLINLVANAIQHTAQGGVMLRTTVARWDSPEQARVRCEVEDSGLGIAPEDQEHVFLPFVQLRNPAGAEAGTGLGLAICKQYVELLGGSIGLQSELGKGSVFYIEIPVVALASQEQPDTPSRGQVRGLAPGQPRYRVLIAEDQWENRLLLRRLLEPLGLDLREAANGKEAVDLCESWRPDLIWMDIRMPVLDGLDATRRIRSRSGGKALKIVALTAHALEDERQQILQAGCDILIRKPFRDTEIYEALETQLGLVLQYDDQPPSSRNLEPRAGCLGGVPRSLVVDLRQAAELLDSAGCNKAVQEIAAQDPQLGCLLGKMVDQYQFKELLDLLETPRGEQGS